MHIAVRFWGHVIGTQGHLPWPWAAPRAWQSLYTYAPATCRVRKVVLTVPRGLLHQSRLAHVVRAKGMLWNEIASYTALCVHTYNKHVPCSRGVKPAGFAKWCSLYLERLCINCTLLAHIGGFQVSSSSSPRKVRWKKRSHRVVLYGYTYNKHVPYSRVVNL